MTDLPYPEGYSSYEAWIEAHAGDSPPLRECLAVSARIRYPWQPCGKCEWCLALAKSDWPQRPKPAWPPSDEASEDPDDQ